jgi:hypothetical protein
MSRSHALAGLAATLGFVGEDKDVRVAGLFSGQATFEAAVLFDLDEAERRASGADVGDASESTA